MSRVATLQQNINDKYSHLVNESTLHCQQLTVVVDKDYLIEFAKFCIDDETLGFDMLIDVCGVDYLHYGISEWATEETTDTGFSRGVVSTQEQSDMVVFDRHRYAAVYHLLSIKNNQRLRIKVYLSAEDLRIPTVVECWPAANWFEREAFDLYGIVFDGHPDLRRILTDYGFTGHPFRKDFPLSGHVEVRYDAKQQRVVYEPVDIEPRVGVPKVIRDDNRYLSEED